MEFNLILSSIYLYFYNVGLKLNNIIGVGIVKKKKAFKGIIHLTWESEKAVFKIIKLIFGSEKWLMIKNIIHLKLQPWKKPFVNSK